MPGDTAQTPHYAMKIPVGVCLNWKAAVPLGSSALMTSSSRLLET